MKKKKVMLLGNHAFVIYNFRKELILQLLEDGYEVYLSMPYDDDKVPKMIGWGCKFIETNVDRRGTNPINDLKLVRHYLKIIRRHSPDIVLTYTIKPNLYGGVACSILNTPYLTNITGLGSGFKETNKLRKLLVFLYKIGLKKSSKVFFQNTHDQKVLISNGIIQSKYEIIPGSGVNLKEYKSVPFPQTEEIRFIFIGRIMKDKGIKEYLKAAKIIKLKYGKKVKFDLVGFIEETEIELQEEINELVKGDFINYLGYQSNVQPYLEKVHCLIQPSHGGEGISNVLLEAAAMGRILIASNIPGCKETIDEDKNGYLFEAKDSNSLSNKIEQIILADNNKLKSMSNYSRKKVEIEFDRKIVIDKYMNEVFEWTGY